jgi:predicted DNA-binding transcriptional regulator AlpA
MHQKEQLDQSNAAAYLGVSTATLEKWRSLKKGPAYFKLGHFVRYTQSDLDGWIASRRVDPGRANAVLK